MRGKFSEKYLLADPLGDVAKNYICGLKIGQVRFVFFLLMLMGLGACLEQGDCLVTNTTLAKVKLKSVKTNADTTIAFASVAIGDDVLLYENQSLNNLVLPVNPAADSTLYVFEYGERKDTLVLRYRNETVVLSPDCGAFVFQRDLRASKNKVGVDSVRWLNNQLLKSVTVNAEIFF